MYAVIFTATMHELDEEYHASAERMRELAMQQYGCIEFVSVTEGDEEISISYWRDLDQIKRWKENPEHVQVQKIGKTRWYRSYRVQITEVLREYHQNSQALLQKTKNEA